MKWPGPNSFFKARLPPLEPWTDDDTPEVTRSGPLAESAKEDSAYQGDNAFGAGGKAETLAFNHSQQTLKVGVRIWIPPY